MSILFKDFEKEENDFFNKYFLTGTKGFKLENKFKGNNKSLYINPFFENHNFGLNFHYDMAEKGIKTRFGLLNNKTGTGNFSWEKRCPTAGYHKVELKDSFELNFSDYQGALSQESSYNIFSIFSDHRFSNKQGPLSNLGFSMDIPWLKNLTIGMGTTYRVCKKQFGLSNVGATFRPNNAIKISGKIDQEKSYMISAIGNLSKILNCSYLKGWNVIGQLQQENEKGKKVNLGASKLLPTGDLLNIKTDLTGSMGLCVIRQFNNNSRVSIGIEGTIEELKTNPTEKLSVSFISE